MFGNVVSRLHGSLLLSLDRLAEEPDKGEDKSKNIAEVSERGGQKPHHEMFTTATSKPE